MIVGDLIEVGVAVADLHASSRSFAALLRARVAEPVRAPMFSMDYRMCRLGHVDFELMQPYGSDSVVSRFLSRRGEGLHHVAFQVADLDETIASCRARGLPVTSEEPVLLGGLRAMFLHPGCMSGLLVEFVENVETWGRTDPRDLHDIGRVSGFGVAVKDVDRAAADYAKVLGAEISGRQWSETLGAHVRFADVGDIRFELVPSSAPARLASGREGLRHVSLDIRDPEARDALRRLSLPADTGGPDAAFLTDPCACHGVPFQVRAG